MSVDGIVGNAAARGGAVWSGVRWKQTFGSASGTFWRSCGPRWMQLKAIKERVDRDTSQCSLGVSEGKVKGSTTDIHWYIT